MSRSLASWQDARPWVVLAVTTVAMLFTFGTPLSYGLFIEPFGEAFDLSATTLSTVFAVELFAFYVGAGAVSVYATRLSSRAVLLACGALCVLLSGSLYAVDSVLGLTTVFVLLGGAIGTAFVLFVSIVPQWFTEYRGVATGILLAGNGFSLFALPPVWQRAFDTVGPRRGFFVIVLLTGAAFLLAGLVCRRPPDVGRSETSMAALWEWFTGLLATRQFRYLLIGKGLSFAWYYLLAAYAVDLFVDRGIDVASAALVFGLVGGVSILSRLATGLLADRIGYRPAFFASMGAATIGGVLLFVPTEPSVYLAVICFGVGLGGIATLYVPILLQVYDPRKSTAIVGTFNIGTGAFGLLSPPVALALTGGESGYDAVIGLTVLASLGAIVFFWLGLRIDGTALSDPD